MKVKQGSWSLTQAGAGETLCLSMPQFVPYLFIYLQYLFVHGELSLKLPQQATNPAS